MARYIAYRWFFFQTDLALRAAGKQASHDGEAGSLRALHDVAKGTQAAALLRLVKRELSFAKVPD